MRLLYIFLIGGLLSITSSCKRNGGNDERALRICNCYDQIHNESAFSNNEEDLQKKVDVCNELFYNTLSSLNTDEKDAFMKAYRECQEH